MSISALDHHLFSGLSLKFIDSRYIRGKINPIWVLFSLRFFLPDKETVFLNLSRKRYRCRGEIRWSGYGRQPSFAYIDELAAFVKKHSLQAG